MIFIRIFIVMIFCCWQAQVAQALEAGFFKTRWPQVREQIEALATETSLSGRMTLDCTPSDQWIVPSIDLADGVKLQLSFPTEKYLKECYPSDHPMYTIFHRDGEIIVYYLSGLPSVIEKNVPAVIASPPKADEAIQIARNDGIVLKEWIYTETPNVKDGSRYAWELKTLGGDEHDFRVEPKDDGGLTVYGKDQSWRVDPIKYWAADGSQGSTDIKISVNNPSTTNHPTNTARSSVIASPRRAKQSYDTTTAANTYELGFHIPATKNQYPLFIDPTINYGDWVGSNEGNSTSVLAIVIETVNDEIYAGGYSNGYFSGGTTQAGTFTLGASEGFVVEIPDGATPTINWIQWLGGTGGDQVKALAVNGDEVYAGGFGSADTSFETVSTVAGTYTSNLEGFVVEISDAATPTISWLQWLGGTSGDEVNAIAVNGDEVYAGGSSVTVSSWETASTVAGTFGGTGSFPTEGFLVEISDGATPTLAWLQWLGGGDFDTLFSLAVTGDEVYAGGYSFTSVSWDTAGVVRGTFAGGGFSQSEGWVVEVADAATPTIAWIQWLGGAGSDQVRALAVTGDEVYAGGYTQSSGNWDTVTTKAGTYNGVNQEGFVVEIADGATPALVWLEWLGGGGTNSEVKVLAVTGDEVYAEGYSDSSGSWETVTTQAGTFTTGNEGWVVEIADAATPIISWLQWLGGNGGGKTFSSLAVNGDEVYAGGYSDQINSNWETVTTEAGTELTTATEGFILEIADAATPTIPWRQWMGGSGGTTDIKALAVNGDEIYTGGYSGGYFITGATVAGTHSGGSEGFVVEIADGGTPTVNWLQWLGGGGNDVATALAINGDEIYAGGYSFSSTDSWDTVGAQGGTYNGLVEGWVVEIADGGTPSVNWRQWLGATTTSIFENLTALAVTGDEVYAGGYSDSSDSWDTAGVVAGTFNATLTEGWVVEIADAATPTINWLQWLGGDGGDQVLALALNGDEIYAGGGTNASENWDTVGTQAGTKNGAIGSSEGFVIEIADAATPTIAWLQWLGGDALNDQVLALTVSGDEVYAGGQTVVTTASWETMGTTAGTASGGTEGWVVEIADAATPTVNWMQWLGSNGRDSVTTLAVNGDEVYAGGNSFSSTANWETLGTQYGTYSGITEGWVVEIADAATPTINWIQWLGGTGTDLLNAMAISGDEVYASGTFVTITNWEATMPNNFEKQVGFYVEISDDIVAGGSGNDTIFFDMSF